MKKELMKIMDTSGDEIFTIDTYINELKKTNEDDSAWIALMEIALEGNFRQKYVALTVFYDNKPRLLETLSLELIKNKKISQIEPILTPVLKICSYIEKEPHLNYMLDILDYFFKKNNQEYYIITLRSIVATKYWKKTIDKIKYFIANSNNQSVVDLLAFFIHKHGRSKYNDLLNSLPKDSQKKVLQQQNNILKRFEEAYYHLN